MAQADQVDDKKDNFPRGLGDLAYLAVLGVLAGALALFGLLVYQVWHNPNWNNLAATHFPVTVGLPLAALTSFVIVALFRTTEGKIEFKVPGFSFSGASGPIIMWVLCFLAITTGVGILWPLH